MGRPLSNSATWFSHDAGMRNHRKIKALRSKFKKTCTNPDGSTVQISFGYAIWNMLLEYLTGNDGNVFEYNDVELEFIAGDFDYPVEDVRDVIQWCLKMEMIFLEEGFIHSESLNDRLKPLYDKRGRSRQSSEKQKRKKGKFVVSNPVAPELQTAETPQTILEESKEEESKEKIKKFDFKKSLLELGVEEKVAVDFIKNRKTKKLTNTETALDGIKSEIIKSGLSPHEAIKISAESGWGSFKAQWLSNINNNGRGQQSTGSTGTTKLSKW